MITLTISNYLDARCPLTHSLTHPLTLSVVSVVAGCLSVCRYLLNLKIGLVEHRASIEPPDTLTPRNLLRISVGLEDVGDLLADLDQALNASDSPVVRQLRHKPIHIIWNHAARDSHVTATPHAPCGIPDLFDAHAYRMLIGACNLMVRSIN